MEEKAQRKKRSSAASFFREKSFVVESLPLPPARCEILISTWREGGGERQKAQGGEGRREEEFLLVSLSLSVSLEDELEATWGQRERE